ncbi:2-hydroxy-3-keto-5-methylthiopentenyl-1-phosphate phosphatase [Marinicrinis lubricantis]|uniref:2-hydroxy-3-keto-5-methylthiopentenyl-1-phosphate phosphatase n=1 Tax=Marinicrinis lubricantis TaxID=2086470 RepID=A0ABW1ILV7_9BACL
MSQTKKPVIFCDFDGTITETDNIVAIMQHFKPEGWEDIVKQIVSQEISVKDGVGRMFELLPVSRKQEIIDFAIRNAKIRSGFAEFVDYCSSHDIELFITSGGIDFFIYPLLEPYPIPEDHIYCNGSDFFGETIRIVWPHPCDDECDNDCGMCKTKIIRSFSKETHYRILIGDSITDFAGAKLVDLIFARSHLKEQCELEGKPYIAYEDFYTVVEHLERTAKELQ